MMINDCIIPEGARAADLMRIEEKYAYNLAASHRCWRAMIQMKSIFVRQWRRQADVGFIEWKLFSTSDHRTENIRTYKRMAWYF